MISNGDFSVKDPQKEFPEAWLPIGGNPASSWKHKQEDQERSHIEITNSSRSRAGIVQTADSSLKVGSVRLWLIKMEFKIQPLDLKAYLRLYPENHNGDVLFPYEFIVYPRRTNEKVKLFKQIVRLDPDVRSLRLEAGIQGAGQFGIYRLSTVPFVSRRVEVFWGKKLQAPVIEHIQSIGEIQNPIRLAAPIPVDVQAKFNPEIRNLTPKRDQVQIVGSAQVPLATTPDGHALVEVQRHGFQESFEDVTVGPTVAYTTIRDVSALARFSYAVYNDGSHPAFVAVQLSPNGLHWTGEGSPSRVESKALRILAPRDFLRYTRLSFEAEGPTMLKVWVQAQN